MKAVNLYALTRVRSCEMMSGLLQVMSGRTYQGPVSPHEAASLCALTDRLVRHFKENGSRIPDASWLNYLDGFYFSFIIDHIGKEFDLLKLSADMDCILNIELKSEDVGEERIRRQLAQNRYYLSHISNTIYSFTYVMETDALYQLNDRGYLRTVTAGDLAAVLMRPALQNFVSENLGSRFRASDYLISPVSVPDKFLSRQYFLTNQQAEFRKQILRIFQDYISDADRAGEVPVVLIRGIAGTGKTLLLYDIAMALSEKRRVLLLHAGPLRSGHLIINERLRKVMIRSALCPETFPDPGTVSCLLIDEANRLPCEVLTALLDYASGTGIPVIAACDPHSLLTGHRPAPMADELLKSRQTASFEFSGHIRINRPVYSFLRTLFNLNDCFGHPDYSCIDVLYAEGEEETGLLKAYYLDAGYHIIDTSSGEESEDEMIGEEYDCVMVLMDGNFEYDESLNLHMSGGSADALALLYEGFMRTREKLCLLIRDNSELFARVLAIRMQQRTGKKAGTPPVSEEIPRDNKK